MSISIRRFRSDQADFSQQMDELLAWDSVSDASVQETVTNIVNDVRARGDDALIEYTNRFDRMSVSSMVDLESTQKQLQDALDGLDEAKRNALLVAAQRVRDYHDKQKQDSWQYSEADGTVLGQKVTPMDRVGIYVPGGKAAYPSSVLMNAIPAHVAGVSEIIMVVPTPDGELNQLVLAAAAAAGVTRVFTVGGAQAVAALAYGTATVPKVDKIVEIGRAHV